VFKLNSSFFGKILNFIYLSRFILTSPITYKYYRFYKKSQFWSAGKLQDYQFSTIRNLLCYAYENHDFYRELYDEHGVHPNDYKELADIAKFPVVTKAALKKGLKEGKFRLPPDVIWHSTSGSSGEPFTFPIDRDGEKRRKACKLRSEEWYGKNLGKKWVRIWRGGKRSFKKSLFDYLLARKLEITFYRLGRSENNRIDDQRLQSFIDRLNESESEIVEGYVSALSLIADFSIRTKQKFPKIKTVVTGAEYLSPHARKLISEGFGAQVYNRYGGTEIGLIAHEDDFHNFISMADRLYFESIKSNSDIDCSELIITDFTNSAMPFIRYAVGDLIEDLADGVETQSNKSMLIMGEVKGRVNEFFSMPDGSLLTSHIWHVFFRDKPVRQFQVIQKKDYSIEIKVVPNDILNEKKMMVGLSEIVPEAIIKLVVVDEIHHGSNGKFNHIISEVTEPINSINDSLIPPARNIAKMAAYIPAAGRDINAETSLKLDWNESTIEPMQKVKQKLKNAIDRPNFLNWYPPVEKEDVKKKVGAYVGVNASSIELFPGSDSALDFLCKVFLTDGDIVGLVEPTYDQARLIFEIHGASLRRYRFENLVKPVFSELKNNISGKERLVYLSNPNNPTGHVWSASKLSELLSENPTILFVVDEAYMDFCQEMSAVPLVSKYSNIIVTRTFSKALGLASVRLGYIVYPDGYRDFFSKVVNVKDINSLSLIAASSLLDNVSDIISFVKSINQGRDFLMFGLSSLGYSCVSGHGNFLLVKFKEPKRIIAHLALNEIYVRDWSNYPGLEGYVRITTGTVPQMERLLEVISAYE